MSYYLGEIWLEEERSFWSFKKAHLFTTRLIEASSWKEAKEKFKVFSDDYMDKANLKRTYTTFVMPAL